MQYASSVVVPDGVRYVDSSSVYAFLCAEIESGRTTLAAQQYAFNAHSSQTAYELELTIQCTQSARDELQRLKSVALADDGVSSSQQAMVPLATHDECCARMHERNESLACELSEAKQHSAALMLDTRSRTTARVEHERIERMSAESECARVSAEHACETQRLRAQIEAQARSIQSNALAFEDARRASDECFQQQIDSLRKSACDDALLHTEAMTRKKRHHEASVTSKNHLAAAIASRKSSNKMTKLIASCDKKQLKMEDQAHVIVMLKKNVTDQETRHDDNLRKMNDSHGIAFNAAKEYVANYSKYDLNAQKHDDVISGMRRALVDTLDAQSAASQAWHEKVLHYEQRIEMLAELKKIPNSTCLDVTQFANEHSHSDWSMPQKAETAMHAATCEITMRCATLAYTYLVNRSSLERSQAQTLSASYRATEHLMKSLE